MHPSSMENMKKMRSKHLSYLQRLKTVMICDVGGIYNQPQKSYKCIFNDLSGLKWYVCDIADHVTVTDRMRDLFTLPFTDSTFDLVVSGQMLEHCQNPFRSVAEMSRILKAGSKMVLIAPSTGPRHDKQDGWRFMDDAFRFIVKEVGGLEIIEDYIDISSEKWRDHIFVGKKI